MSAHVLRTMGRFTGYLIRSHAIDRAVSAATKYALREIKCTDIRLKIALLRKKREHHLTLLGRTVYRLFINEQDPLTDNHIHTITIVLSEIDTELEQACAELARRKTHENKTRH